MPGAGSHTLDLVVLVVTALLALLVAGSVMGLGRTLVPALRRWWAVVRRDRNDPRLHLTLREALTLRWRTARIVRQERERGAREVQRALAGGGLELAGALDSADGLKLLLPGGKVILLQGTSPVDRMRVCALDLERRRRRRIIAVHALMQTRWHSRRPRYALPVSHGNSTVVVFAREVRLLVPASAG